MKPTDIALLAGIFAALALAVRQCVRRRGKCCGGDCSACGQHCAGRNAQNGSGKAP